MPASQPVLLLWGADDPWIRPQSADRIQKLYPKAEKVLLPGVGHCPQVSRYRTLLFVCVRPATYIMMSSKEHGIGLSYLMPTTLWSQHQPHCAAEELK